MNSLQALRSKSRSIGTKEVLGKEYVNYLLGGLFVLLFVSLYLFYIFPIGQQLRRHAAWVGLSLLIAYLLYREDRGITVEELFFITITLLSTAYIVLNYEAITERQHVVTTTEALLGSLFFLTLAEGTRRSYGVTGRILFYFVVVAFGFMVFGHHIPGMLGHRQVSYDSVIRTQYLTTSGTFSFILGVIINFVVPFIVFGKLLEHLGGTQYFMDISRSATSKMTGGAPKLAVIASALMGTINGSVVANIASTGAGTIPIMKKSGLSSRYAGAVESAASTGGQILPPIMGIAIFIMVGITGIPYLEIARRATIPALLFFFGLFLYIHLSAQRYGFEFVEFSDETPNRRNLLFRIYYVIPIVLLVYLLIGGTTLTFAAIYSSLALLVLGLLLPESRINYQRAKKIIIESMELSAAIIVLTASIAFVVGVTGRTGLGLQMSSLIISFAGGNFALILAFTIIASFILGMGLSSTILSYILLATLVAPALVETGMTELSAHLFVFYYGIFAMITPPVGLGIITASGIADADPMGTGITAMKMCTPALILPILWVLAPGLLMYGTTSQILLAFLLGFTIITLLTVSAVGYFRRELRVSERVVISLPVLGLFYLATLV